jgi:hypothetical protein
LESAQGTIGSQELRGQLAVVLTTSGQDRGDILNPMASSSRCPDSFVIPILHDFLYGVFHNLRSQASGKCVIMECSST